MPKKRHGGAIRPSLLKVGDSPVAGLKLRHCLSDVLESKFDCAWSPDGRFLAFVSKQHSIQTFDVVSVGTNALAALGDDDHVFCLAWSADSKRLAGAAGRKGVSVWDAPTGERIWEFKEHTGWVGKVACSHEGGTLASGSQDQTIRLWDMNSGSSLGVLQGHTDYVNAIAWSPDDRMLASGSADRRVALWDPRSAKRLGILEGATEIIVTIAFSHDGRTLAVGNGSSIHLWDIEQRHLLTILEGHTGRVELISFSSSGKLMASISGSGLLLWRTDTWSQVAAPQIEGVRYGESALAFHPHMPILATATSTDSAACIWDVDERLLLGQSSSSVHYATAKLVLVGDSGVGKTGLGWRLAHDEFKEHASTHGQQFWTVPRLGLTRKDGTECEAVLWDLAGQPVYRSVHSIFLEDLHASLILFDPTNRHEPLKGAQFWLEQLKGKQRLPPSVLVGARVDRGAAVLPQAELDQFCQQYGISGGYIGVSAKSGEGLDRLVDVVRKEIDWDRMTATVTTETFKRIKDYVLALKEDTRRASALVQPQDLRNRLQGLDASWEFTDLEMMTALGHLQNHGYVTILRSSPGQEWVLLAADLLASLASSIVILADKNPRELGAVSERELLENRYQFPELAGLDTVDQQILIDAAVVRFLQHSVCFRETFGDDTLLIFPGLIKQKRPLQDETRLTDDVSYVVRGKVENIYASLVVLLGYTPSFNRVNQWQHHTQYVIGPEEICGFRMIEEREGEIELVLYYGEQMHVQGRRRFQEVFEQFLYQRDVQVTRYAPVACENGHLQKRATIMERMRSRKLFTFCDECGVRVDLPRTPEPSVGTSASPWLQREEAMARLHASYEGHLLRIKGYRRGWAAPRCYLSYAPAQGAWATRIGRDLNDAGVYILKNPSEVTEDDYVVILDSSSYQEAWRTDHGPLREQVQLVHQRLSKESRRLVSINVESGVRSGSTHGVDSCRVGEFSDETHYHVSLFNLALNLYAIPLDHAGFEPLRQALHQQWEETLPASLPQSSRGAASATRVFISYAHKDEEFKDELLIMLAGLQNRGVIDIWHDRKIESGDEWHKAIRQAMAECSLALLLVSPHFISSRFIQDEELKLLLERRKRDGLRVVPVIVRPCLWKSEPVLRELQALPKNGKPVITFAADTGERDQVWVEIGAAIEARASCD